MNGASVESMSIREKVLLLIEPGTRARWLGLAVLAVGLAIIEAVGALLIFGLLDLMSGAGDISLPVIGDLSNRFPDASDQQMLTGLLIVSALFLLFDRSQFSVRSICSDVRSSAQVQRSRLGSTKAT